ncbi:hypothetical protein TNCV_3942271 [Trichonephila clavipes]|nr:hypothetical protein TNCV_3942271 [Trichonephila clavipes]
MPPNHLSSITEIQSQPIASLSQPIKFTYKLPWLNPELSLMTFSRRNQMESPPMMTPYLPVILQSPFSLQKITIRKYFSPQSGLFHFHQATNHYLLWDGGTCVPYPNNVNQTKVVPSLFRTQTSLLAHVSLREQMIELEQ